jgi:hypothetical protein
MSDPSIIGSGKPHTVKLAEGSKIATQRPTRAAGGRLPEDLPLLVRAGHAPEPLADPVRKAAQLRSNSDTAADVASQAPPRLAAETLSAPSLLLTRIAQLEQRNRNIRAQLEPSTDATDKPGKVPR